MSSESIYTNAVGGHRSLVGLFKDHFVHTLFVPVNVSGELRRKFGPAQKGQKLEFNSVFIVTKKEIIYWKTRPWETNFRRVAFISETWSTVLFSKIKLKKTQVCAQNCVSKNGRYVHAMCVIHHRKRSTLWKFNYWPHDKSHKVTSLQLFWFFSIFYRITTKQRFHIISFEPITSRSSANSFYELSMTSVSTDVIGEFWLATKRELVGIVWIVKILKRTKS